jgi:mRNA interferase MazF
MVYLHCRNKQGDLQMKTTVQRWGHSLALRIPKPLAVELGLSHDAHVDVRLVDGQLIITPLPQSPFTLEQLLAGLTEANQHAELTPGDAAEQQPTRQRVYIPARGDLLQIRSRQSSDTEQAPPRFVVVLSPVTYNQKTGLALICPITDQIRGHPFEVPMPHNAAVGGVILADQVRVFDWNPHAIACMGRLPGSTVIEVLQKLGTLIFADNP